MFVPILEIGLEGSIPSLFCGIGADCYTFGKFGKFGSNSYIYSSTPSWAWDCDSHLGHLWCSYPFDFFSHFGKICGFILYLRGMEFSFCFYYCWCCFFSNFVACWGWKLPLIVMSSFFLCLFIRLSLSSSSSDRDIKTTLLVVLLSGYSSFLK